MLSAIHQSLRPMGTAKTAFIRAVASVGGAAAAAEREFVVPVMRATIGDIAVAKMSTAGGDVNSS